MRRLTPDHLQSTGTTLRLDPVGVKPIPLSSAEDTAHQLQTAFNEARNRGFNEGMQDATREIDRRIKQLIKELKDEHGAAMGSLQASQDDLNRLLAALPAALQNHADDMEVLAIEIAFAAIARVLGDKAADRSLLASLCRAAVREFGHSQATLRVSDDDYALIDAAAIDIPVEVDRRLSPGQCVIDTARGQFESGLDVRLEAIKQALLHGLSEHRSGS